MRVAMVGPTPVSDRITGGIEAVTAALVPALREIVDVQVVTVARAGGVTTTREGIRINVIPSSGRRARPTLYAAERRRIRDAIAKLRPDVVHVQGQNFYAAAAYAAGFPTVMTVHGLLFLEARISDRRSGVLEHTSRTVRSRANAIFESRALHDATDIISISPYVAATLQSRTRARLHPIDNPVSARWFDVRRRPCASTVLMAGTIEPRKDVHLAVQALHRIRSGGLNVSLRHAGMVADRRYFRSVRALTARLGLQHAVTFLGPLPDDALAAEYESAAVLLMTSREETSPIAVQQAMACRLPVVATSVGGLPHLVDDGRTGLLVEREAGAIAAGVTGLLRDAARREALGAAAADHATARFSPDVVARKTFAVYESVWRESVTA